MGLVEKNVFILPKIPITNSSLQEVVYYIQYIIYSLSFLNIYNRYMIQIEYNQDTHLLEKTYSDFIHSVIKVCRKNYD